MLVLWVGFVLCVVAIVLAIWGLFNKQAVTVTPTAAPQPTTVTPTAAPQPTTITATTDTPQPTATVTPTSLQPVMTQTNPPTQPAIISVSNVTTNFTLTPLPASGTQVLLPFLDISGNDLPGSPLTGVASASSCLTTCTNTSGCAGISYAPTSQQCWLKKNMFNAGITATGQGAAQRVIGHVGSLWSNSMLSGPLLNGQALVSSNSQFALLMQSDNNLLIYSLVTGNPLWATNTAGKAPPGAAHMELDLDSNLAVYYSQMPQIALWTSGTQGGTSSSYSVTLLDTGVLAVNDAAGSLVWSSAQGALITNKPTPAPLIIATISGPNTPTITVSASQVGQHIPLNVSSTYTSLVTVSGYTTSITGPAQANAMVSGPSTWTGPYTGFNSIQVFVG